MSVFKRFFPKTLFGRIFAILTTLIAVQFLLHTFLAFILIWRTIAETEQHRNWGLARDVAHAIQPALGGEDGSGVVDYLKLRTIIGDFQRYNSTVDIFLLNSAGEVLANLGRTRELARNTIDLAPVREFIRLGNGASGVDLLADDPKASSGKIVFSAASVRLKPGESGFVFIPLVNDVRSLAFELFAKSTSFQAFLLGGVFYLFAFLIVGRIALRGVSRAFADIMRSVRAYSEGQFDVPVRLERDDELGAVGGVLNQMASSLSEKIRELRQKDELRRELIMDVVHDLHGPTGTMSGFLELLREGGERTPAEREEYYKSLETGLEQLTALTDELSQLFQLEVGELRPVLLACNAKALAEEIVAFYRKRGESLGITLKTEYPDDLPAVLCDEAMIRRVLQNLIENALRYTDMDGCITVRLKRFGSNVEFAVADTGIGIPQGALGRIFERRAQEESGGAMRKGKSGLGLAIVRRIIEAHQSTIEVASSENVGTTFSFRLPVGEIEPVRS